MSALDPEQREIVRDILGGALPVNPMPGSFVTRDEFEAALKTIEGKIENSGLRQRNWVLLGCLTIIMAFGGGYVSLVSKLDRVTEALPVLAAKQDARAPWIQRQEQRDQMQDDVLKKLDRDYQPLPYQAPPQ